MIRRIPPPSPSTMTHVCQVTREKKGACVSVKKRRKLFSAEMTSFCWLWVFRNTNGHQYSNHRAESIQSGLWGAPSEWSRDLVTYPCPPGYCYCNGAINNSDIREGCQLHFSQPEIICVSKRRRNGSLRNDSMASILVLDFLKILSAHNISIDVLCGRCIEGYGVGLLTNNCRKHENSIPDYYWLLPIYGTSW